MFGLSFPAKEDADAFTAMMKNAVDNLNRIGVSSSSSSSTSSTSSTSSSSCPSAGMSHHGGSVGGNMMMMADNISIGKRSTTSSDYNQSIYDDNDSRYVFVYYYVIANEFLIDY